MYSENTYQPVHKRSMIRVFVVRPRSIRALAIHTANSEYSDLVAQGAHTLAWRIYISESTYSQFPVILFIIFELVYM